MADASELSRLRQEISNIDRQVLQLVRRRMDIAEQIGQSKQNSGLPVRDFRREVEVLRQARQESVGIGLDAELGETLIRQLIEGAVRTQHTMAAASQKPAEARPQKVVVLGGGGRMGAWLCSFFNSQGHDVRLYDPHARELPEFPAEATLASAVSWAEVVVLSTPIGESARVLEEVLAVPSDALIFDICSLKSPLLDAIERGVRAGRRISSVHPMFAPGAVLLSGRVLLVCDCGHAEAARQARALFEDTALRLVDIPLQEHDRLMGVVLGMSHALNIAFASALKHIGFTYPELDRTSSTTFGRQIRTTAEVVAENPRLYYEIQHYNRYTPTMLQALREAVERVMLAAEADTPDRFLELMAEGHGFFAERPAEAGPRVVG